MDKENRSKRRAILCNLDKKCTLNIIFLKVLGETADKVYLAKVKWK